MHVLLKVLRAPSVKIPVQPKVSQMYLIMEFFCPLTLIDIGEIAFCGAHSGTCWETEHPIGWSGPWSSREKGLRRQKITLTFTHHERLCNWSKYLLSLHWPLVWPSDLLWSMTCERKWHMSLLGRSYKSHCLMTLSALLSFYYETGAAQIGAAWSAWVLQWKRHETESQTIPSGQGAWARNTSLWS